MERNNNISSTEFLNKLDNLLQKNDYEKAKQHALYWLSEYRSTGDLRNELLTNNELIGLCRKLGDEAETISHVKSALDLIKKMKIENNTGAATTYINCATAYKAFGKADKSLPLFERAKEIYENNLSPDDYRFGGLFNNMALALVDLQRYQDADELYNKALHVVGKIKNNEPEQAITHLNMATAAETQYGIEDAHTIIENHLKKAMELLDTGKERTDGNYAFVCEKCAPSFGYYGYFYYENELNERARRIYERA
ncbi:MAG: tetratricopeptide repeat protein [Clostridia bacterium]|nr:tetratricopeptide repeat protein [Clostridia bacterium]